MKEHPLISIVTVCYNGEEYIADCILSVMRQTYTNIEHIIVDGGSTDGTLDIIKKYEGKYNMRYISEKDDGMYNAICKGFDMATGDIFAWLNSDDMYTPWACDTIATVMGKSDIQWCTGIPCHYSPDGIAYNVPRLIPVFPRSLIAKGYMDGRTATCLQQESMFWSKELWKKCGHIIKQYKFAGDFHLWKEFAKYESLVTIDSFISGFRIHEGQKSGDKDKYYSEIGALSFRRKLLKKFRLIKSYSILYSLISKKYFVRINRYLQ